MFPFQLRYRKALPSGLNQVSNQIILEQILDDLEEGGVSWSTIKEGKLIEFKNKTFAIRPWGNLNIWSLISKGNFEIVIENNQRSIVYSFDTSYILIGSFLFGLLVGIVGNSFILGLIVFSASGPFNWLIMVIRHKLKLRNLINELIIKNGL